MSKVLTDIELYKEVLSGQRKRFPNGFWSYFDIPNLESARNITKYLIEDILYWNDEQIKQNLSNKTFIDNRLGGMLQLVFSGSTFKALDNVYPNEFKEWELAHTPQNFWNLEKAIEATTWLIEEKLQWNDEQIKQNLCKQTFYDNKLGGMLQLVFNSSPFKAFNNTYPGKFKEWEFSYTPQNFWNLKKAIEATTWLIEEKLQWNDEQIKQNLSQKTFFDNGLHGMLQVLFNNSPFKALDNAYPAKFKPNDLKKSPKN